MVHFEYAESYGIDELKKIVKILRGPDGCPWDREQTHESIRRDLLEEAYELVNAIDQKDPENLREELGDVLLQVVFHTDLEQDVNGLTLDWDKDAKYWAFYIGEEYATTGVDQTKAEAGVTYTLRPEG